jgi:hypothetical protein
MWLRRYPEGMDDAGKVAGLYYEHPGRSGEVCHGWITFKPYWKDGWDVQSWEPLTISPSLLCRACGHHGFIRGGRWVPC